MKVSLRGSTQEGGQERWARKKGGRVKRETHEPDKTMPASSEVVVAAFAAIGSGSVGGVEG